MAKSGIRIDIPGRARLHIQAMCSDYTGTLSYSGKLIDGVRERLCRLSQSLDIHVVTSDTRKTARSQLRGVPLAALEDEIPIERHDEYKRDYLTKLGLPLNQIVVLGNGRNDRLWLKEARDGGGLAIALDAGEGCAIEAMTNAHIFVVGIISAVDLLLDENRVAATLGTG
jgi:soluble P-type ATPase